ncbi:MAG: histidine kinase [Kineosporiaceae bacterium]
MHEELRWTTPVGLAVVGLVVVANAAGGVGLGTSGDPLVVTVSVTVYCVAAVVFLLWFDAPRAATIALLLVMGFAATATHHGDPTGTGGIGLYLGVAFAPLRLPVRTAAVVSAIVVLAFNVQLALEATNAFVFILVVDGGAAFFFLLGTLLRREREQRLEVARLLAELEESREVEKAAAALAERSRLAREMHDVLAHTLSGLALAPAGREVAGARRRPSWSGGGRARRRPGPGAYAGPRRVGRGAAGDQGLAGGGPAGPGAAAGAGRGVPERPARRGRVDRGRDAGPATGRRPPGAVQDRSGGPEQRGQARPRGRRRRPLAWGADEVSLVVENAGGQPPDVEVSASGSGYGLTGMAERARLLGGELAAGPTSSGFRVELRLPLQRPASGFHGAGDADLEVRA